MAFRKRTFKTRFPKKRRMFKKRPFNQGALALTMVKQLKRQTSPEVKTFGSVFGSTPLQSGGVVNMLNTISQGTADINRVGTSIKLLRVSGRITLRMNDASSAPTNTVRLILFRGKQENEQPYFPNDVLANPGGLQLIVSPKNWDNRFHTKFIYDKTYTLSRQGRSNIALDWNFKLFGHTQFNQGSGEIETGGLYLLAIGDRGVPDAPLMETYLRISFTDA